MCKHCFEKEYYGFKSNLEFKDFENEFYKKIAKSVRFVRTSAQGDIIHPTIYKCDYCQQNWWLSDPDNQWRGYFLKEENAKNYEQKSSGACVLYIIAILIVAIIIYYF